MPPCSEQQYFCDCTCYCVCGARTQPKLVSRATYFNHAKYRSLAQPHITPFSGVVPPGHPLHDTAPAIGNPIGPQTGSRRSRSPVPSPPLVFPMSDRQTGRRSRSASPPRQSISGYWSLSPPTLPVGTLQPPVSDSEGDSGPNAVRVGNAPGAAQI